MNALETVTRLIALASDEAGAPEERRTAAMQAVTMMRKHSLVPWAVGEGDGTIINPLERLDRFQRRHDQTAATRAMLTSMSERLWEHYPRSSHCPGRAELSALLNAVLGAAYLVAISPEVPPQNEAGDFFALIPTVVRAFDEWAAQQPVPPPEKIQAEIMEKYGEWRDPLPSVDRIACALGVPSPSVAEALESLVEQQRIRCKSGRHTIVRRPTKPKSRMTQEELFR